MRPGLCRKTISSSNSPPVSSTGAAIRRHQRTAFDIRNVIGKHEEALPFRRRRFGAAAAQDCADTRGQFTRIERLSEIVIRTEFQPDDAINILLQRCEQDHGKLRHALAQRPAQIKSGPIGQHDIEDDQIDLQLGQFRFAFTAIAGKSDTKSLAVEIFSKQAPDFQVIVHDENMRCVFHEPL